MRCALLGRNATSGRSAVRLQKMGAGGDLQLARRRSQSLEIECLRRPLNDDSLGRIAQPVATWCDLLAPPVRISDLYAVSGNICPHHLPAAVQGIEIPLHLRIRVPCPPFAGSVAATRPGVSATAWAGVCAIRSRVCTCAVPGSRASARASSRTAAAARPPPEPLLPEPDPPPPDPLLPPCSLASAALISRKGPAASL